MTPHPENASWRILILLFSYFRVRKVKAFFPFLAGDPFSLPCLWLENWSEKINYFLFYIFFFSCFEEKRERILPKIYWGIFFPGQFFFTCETQKNIKDNFLGMFHDYFSLKFPSTFSWKIMYFREMLFFSSCQKVFSHFLLLIWKTKTKKMFFLSPRRKKNNISKVVKIIFSNLKFPSVKTHSKTNFRRKC